MKMTEDLKAALEPSNAERVRAMSDDELVAEGRRVLRDELGIEEAETMTPQEIARTARRLLKENPE